MGTSDTGIYCREGKCEGKARAAQERAVCTAGGSGEGHQTPNQPAGQPCWKPPVRSCSAGGRGCFRLVDLHRSGHAPCRPSRPEQRPSARRPLSAQRRDSSGPPPAHGPPPPPSRPALTDAAAPAGSAGTARPPAPAPCWRGGVCAAGGPSVAEAGGPGWAGGCVVRPARVGGEWVRVRAIKWRTK